WAARLADAGVEQAQVVVDLGDGADGRARIVRGRLLLDRDRRRQPLDVVDVGLVHHAQELARIRRQRLDVAALALRVDRVEGQRGLARARQAGDHDQAVAGQVEADVFQVVRTCSADADEVQRHRWSRGERKGGRSTSLPSLLDGGNVADVQIPGPQERGPANRAPSWTTLRPVSAARGVVHRDGPRAVVGTGVADLVGRAAGAEGFGGEGVDVAAAVGGGRDHFAVE